MEEKTEMRAPQLTTPLKPATTTSVKTGGQSAVDNVTIVNAEDDMLQINTLKYDYCIVLRSSENKSISKLCSKLISSFDQIGLDTYTFIPSDRTLVYILVRPKSIDVLKLFAEKIQYRMKLSPTKLKAYLIGKGIDINDDPMAYKYAPTEYIFANYKQEREELFDYSMELSGSSSIGGGAGSSNSVKSAIGGRSVKRGTDEEAEIDDNYFLSTSNEIDIQNENGKHFLNPFQSTDRIKLVELMLLGGIQKDQSIYELNICKLFRMRHICAYFPLPEHLAKHQLVEIYQLKFKQIFNLFSYFGCFNLNQSRFFPDQDGEMIADYFGSKFNLYFQFVNHLITSLMFPAIVGIAFQVVILVKDDDVSYPVSPFYSLLMSMWSFYLYKSWKRKENDLSLRADTEQYEEGESNRPEFRGIRMKSFVDGSEFRYFSNRKYIFRRVIGALITCCCCFFSLACVAGIYYLQFQLQNTSLYESAQSISSAINVIVIGISSQIFTLISHSTSYWENHRTDTAYEDSLILKSFVFLFINSFASFFFLAFVAQWLEKPPNSADDVVGQCAYASCMNTLQLNLLIIVGSRIFANTFLRFVGTFFSTCYEDRKRRLFISEHSHISEAETEFHKPMIDPFQYFQSQFSELAILVGYSVLFSAALPAIVVFVCMLLSIDKRLDLYDLIQRYQRPNILVSEDIGSWQVVFQLMWVLAVITHAGLIVYTMDTEIASYSRVQKAFIFIGYQWALFSLGWLLDYIIPDMSSDVDIQYKRNDFIEKIVLEGKELDIYTKPKLAASLKTPLKLVPSLSTSLTHSNSPAKSFVVHSLGPISIPIDKMPFSPSRTLSAVQPETQ